MSCITILERTRSRCPRQLTARLGLDTSAYEDSCKQQARRRKFAVTYFVAGSKLRRIEWEA
jgi:hypothetical protein